MFCRAHEAAPAPQRGGWLSAERRRRGLGGTAPTEPSFDATCLTQRLWLGGVPPFDRPLPFDVLVLAAVEHQPAALAFQGRVVRAHLPSSDELRHGEILGALAGARAAARGLVTRKRVLITSHAGRDRGALVAAIALGFATRMTTAQIVELLRRRRGAVLSEPRMQLLARVMRR